MKDITVLPEDYVVTHYKTNLINSYNADDEVVYDIEKSVTRLVRCKDCYHAEDDITHMFCVWFHHKVYEDDYCSNAEERREEREWRQKSEI